MDWDESPEIQAWNRSSTSLQEAGLTAGQELLAGFEQFAASTSRALSDWDRWVLTHGPGDMMTVIDRYAESHSDQETELQAENLRASFVDTARRSILLFREWVEFLKRSNAPTVVVRPGLRLPEWIEDRYEAVYSSNLPWTLSGVMQSAFMGSPELGERKPWKSK